MDTTDEFAELKKRAELYRKHGKRLEADHKGKYVAIFENGNTVIGPDYEQTRIKAEGEVGPGRVICKIGPLRIGPRRGVRK